MPPFNLDFDKELGEHIIEIVQGHAGCFCCNKPDPPMGCSRCKVARYCNQDCQKTDWSVKGEDAGYHKQLCGVYCENRAEENGMKGAIPICLKSIDLIDEDMFMMAMRTRSSLFLREIQKHGEEGGIKVSFQTSVIKLLGKVRLVAACSYVSKDFTRVSLNHVLLENVDEGAQAEQRLYPSSGGAGSISEEAEEKVLDHWVSFMGLLIESGMRVVSITYGRGLMAICEKKSFQEKLEAVGDGMIMWIPDVRYSLMF
jgi:hypothetical protein